MQIDNYLRHQRPGSGGATEHGLQKFTNQAFFFKRIRSRMGQANFCPIFRALSGNF